MNSARRLRFRRMLVVATASSVLGLSGCSSGVAPSRTATGAGAGALGGAAVGSIVGSGSSMGSTTGVLGGAAAGAVVGGLIGLTQDMRERREQDRLAQERAYQQDMARAREAEARAKAAMEEELAVAQGFRISDSELNEAQRLVENATDRLNRLNEERAAAIAKKNALDEAQARLLTTEAEIARLEEELARLRGDSGLDQAEPLDQDDTEAATGSSPPTL